MRQSIAKEMKITLEGSYEYVFAEFDCATCATRASVNLALLLGDKGFVRSFCKECGGVADIYLKLSAVQRLPGT